MPATRRRPARRSSRRSNTRISAAQQRAARAVAKAAGSWLGNTFATDSARIVAIRLPIFNWLILAALAGAWWRWGHQQPRILAAVTAAWLLITMVRAASVIPAHRRALARIYQEVATPAGLPKGTITQPPQPSRYIKVRRWWRSNPARLRVAISTAAPAATPTRRWELQRPLSAIPHRHQSSGGQWWFDWPADNICEATALPADDYRLIQQARATEITSDLVALFGADKVKLAEKHGHSCEVTEWDDFNGDPVIPTGVQFTFGGQDSSDPAFRDQVERGFDRRRRIAGHEWLYDWDTPGALAIRLVPRDSVEAVRKLVARWLSDQVAAAAGRGKEPVVAIVDMWADDPTLGQDEHWVAAQGGDGAVPILGNPTVPVRVVVNIGTRALTGDKGREVLDGVCETARLRFGGMVWVATTEATAGATIIVYEGTPATHPQALRKTEERRLRDVVETKFRGRGKHTGATLEVREWADDTPGEARAALVRATFGSLDMSKEQARGEFQMHLDSAVEHNDWLYDWQHALGYVDLKAVPPLPRFVPFPEPGTREFSRVNDLFLDGKVVFGPIKGGGELTWNLNTIPHALMAGETGAGKSVALTCVVFEALYNPDRTQLWFADPKMMDWPWVREFPNVLGYSNTNEGIADVVDQFSQEMKYRQALLAKRQCVNLTELRRLYADNPTMLDEDGPAPARQILVFDEIMDYLAKVANKDEQEIQDGVKAQMESVARLGRAMEMNMIVAAQKPDGATMGMQLREQLGFRLGMGVLGMTTSQQVFDTDHGTRWLGEAPKGRGWGGKRGSTYEQVQGFYLLPATATDPTGQDRPGAADWVRERLVQLGYQRIEMPGDVPVKWIRTDRIDGDDTVTSTPDE